MELNLNVICARLGVYNNPFSQRYQTLITMKLFMKKKVTRNANINKFYYLKGHQRSK